MHRRTYLRTIGVGAVGATGTGAASGTEGDDGNSEVPDATWAVLTDGFTNEVVEVDGNVVVHRFKIELLNPALVSPAVPATVEIATFEKREGERGAYEWFGSVEREASKRDDGTLWVDVLLDMEDSYRVDEHPVSVSVSQPIDHSVLPTQTMTHAHGLSVSGTGATADDQSRGIRRLWYVREKHSNARTDWQLEALDAVDWNSEDATAGSPIYEFVSTSVREGRERVVLLAAEGDNGAVVRTSDARLFPESSKHVPREQGPEGESESGS